MQYTGCTSGGGWAIYRSFNENKNIKHGKHLNTLQEYWWMMQYTGCRVGVESSIDSWILLLCFFTCPFFRRMRTRQQKKWDTSQPTPKRSVEKTMQCTGCKGGVEPAIELLMILIFSRGQRAKWDFSMKQVHGGNGELCHLEHSGGRLSCTIYFRGGVRIQDASRVALLVRRPVSQSAFSSKGVPKSS